MRAVFGFKSVPIITILALFIRLSFAEDAVPVLAAMGDFPKPQRYTLEQLQKLPTLNVTARDHDGTMAEYTGVSVEEILRRSGAPIGQQLHGAALAKVIVVHAADRYVAAFSLAELDSSLTGRKVLLAWNRNGQPVAASQGPLKLIVPDDKRQARWVRQVTAIELVTLNRPAITNAAAATP